MARPDSEDGWQPARLDPNSSLLAWSIVPGTDPPVHLQIMAGWPTTVLLAFAADLNEFVEHMRDADSACYTPTNSVETSNHLNGTAFDFNWDSHPFHVFGTFNDAQMHTLAELFDFYTIGDLKVIAWGGKDWGGNPQDEMHFQMGYNTWNNPQTADFIQQRIRPDGFSMFRRGATVPPPQLTRAERYAQIIMDVGVQLGITPRGQKIALSVGLVESELTNYANSNDPASLAIPHDAVGSDHMSVGWAQQQPNWGPLEVRMDIAGAARLFYMCDNGPGTRGLTKIRDGNGNLFDYNDTSRTPGFYAQKVQGSAFPDRYDQRFTDAEALYDKLTTFTGSTPGEDDWLTMPSNQEKLDAIFNVLFTSQPPENIYRDGTDPGLNLVDSIRAILSIVYEGTVERLALEGEQESIDKVVRTAKGLGPEQRAWAITRANLIWALGRSGATTPPPPSSRPPLNAEPIVTQAIPVDVTSEVLPATTGHQDPYGSMPSDLLTVLDKLDTFNRAYRSRFDQLTKTDNGQTTTQKELT